VDLNVLTYLLYLALALPLTLWVARALHHYGKVFLIDVFNGDEVLAHAVNQLLVIGFYLLNLGYVALFMTSHTQVDNARRLLEVLSTKVGGVALVIGAVHFANIWAFNAFRRRAVLRARAVPPVTPSGYTPVVPNGYQPAAPDYAPGAPYGYATAAPDYAPGTPNGYTPTDPGGPPPAWPGWVPLPGTVPTSPPAPA
jgi:uncharacterized membrane protein